MAEGRKKNSKTGVLMSMNFGGINQSSATGTRPYVSKDGEIVKTAPLNLRHLNVSYTPDNIKKFMKNFLSIVSPVGISLPIIKNNYE